MTREQAINSMISHGFTVEQAGEIIKAVTPQLSSELDKNSKKLEKNFGELDCISREQALVAIRNLYPSMPRVDFNGSLRKWADKYKPYIECEDAIEELPSVTPQEPRKGHWIEQDGFDGDTYYDCSECGESFCLIDGTPTDNLYNYCPNCGAKMVEPLEQEPKSEWQHDHAILKAYSDGVNEVLDKIRAEIDNALSDGMIHKKTVLGIIDKYKAESEAEDGNDD